MTVKTICALAAAALIAASCSLDQPYDATLDRGGIQEIIIEATIADGMGTKTALNADEKVCWLPGDAINVFFGTADGKFTSLVEEPSTRSSFSGSITSVVGISEEDDDSSYLWGLYPYNEAASFDGHAVITTLSATQTGVPDTFANGTNITLAKSRTFALSFYNVLAGFRFSVTRAGIKSVTFSGNNGEVLAGKLKVAFGGADNRPVVQEVTDGQTAITLTPEGGEFEVGKLYYIVFVPTNFTKGFSVKMEMDGSEGTFVYSQSREFKRSTFLRKVDMDKGVEFSVPGPEYVDLGLSVSWANMNLGASCPEDLGDSYAWGEVEPKETFSWNNYKWGGMDGGSIFLTKYNTSSSYGTGYDSKQILDLEDDAANYALGGNCRMPKQSEWNSLKNSCTWTWECVNGVYGYLVTSNIPGYTDKSIFLPSYAYSIFSEVYYDGEYWTNQLGNDLYSPHKATCIVFYNGDEVGHAYMERYMGCQIRAVKDDAVAIRDIQLDHSNLSMQMGASFSLVATVTSTDSNVNSSVTWSSSNMKVATVDADGLVTSHCAGHAYITATTVVGQRSARCSVTVNQEYVDLGLPSGTKWATCNLGAETPDDYGDPYAWGETTSRDLSSYTMQNYKYYLSYDGSNMRVSKYCTDSNYGRVDNLTQLSQQDDPVIEQLGNGQRMPTGEEIKELVDKCKWEWVQYDSVRGWYPGCWVIGPNGNSIYIPTTDDDDESEWAWLLSSSLDTRFNSSAGALLMDSYQGVKFTSFPRYLGSYIRPVCN